MKHIIEIDRKKFEVDSIHLIPYSIHLIPYHELKAGDVFQHPDDKNIIVAVPSEYKTGRFSMGGLDNKPFSLYSNNSGIKAETFMEYVKGRGHVFLKNINFALTELYF